MNVLSKLLDQRIKQLRTDTPRSGRRIAEDGQVFNETDYMRNDPRSIAHGMWPGARIDGAYGQRVSAGAESRYPIWPDVATVGVAYGGGTQLEVLSTGAGAANDVPGGSGMGHVFIHYLDGDLVERDLTVEMNAGTPVQLPVDDVTFVQCMHTDDFQAGYASGVIVLRATVGGATFSQISVGEPRCSSSFRMVPRGMALYIDGAIGSSISETADVSTTLAIVANEIYDHQYRDPVIWMPFGSVGVQNAPAALNFFGPQSFKEGTIVGGIHSSDKAVTVGLTWIGHLEPVS